MRSPGRKITTAAAFVAAGLILGYIESFFVLPVNIPGFRIGIANIAVVLALYLMGPVYGACVFLTRIVLAALLYGTPVSFMYSLCGALVSYLIMVIISKLGFSVYGVSVAGAVFHNLAQIVVAYLLVENVYVMTYIPVLLFIGAIAGLLVGFISDIMYRRLRRIVNWDGEGL